MNKTDRSRSKRRSKIRRGRSRAGDFARRRAGESADRGARTDLATASRYTLQIRPPHKDGVLSIVARSGSTSSQPLTLRLRKGVPERRPALYAGHRGGRYQSTDIPSLRFAAKGCKRPGHHPAKQRDMLYREISTRVLTDGQAIRSQGDGRTSLADHPSRQRRHRGGVFGRHGTKRSGRDVLLSPTDAQADRATMLSGSELQKMRCGRFQGAWS